jgi:hypothetical protein
MISNATTAYAAKVRRRRMLRMVVALIMRWAIRRIAVGVKTGSVSPSRPARECAGNLVLQAPD